jgi:hypothetical protein
VPTGRRLQLNRAAMYRWGGVAASSTVLGRNLAMTTQAGLEKKERDFLAQCVGDAYTMLDLLPGVDPNGPALVWLADQFLILRRGDCPPAHAMTL